MQGEGMLGGGIELVYVVDLVGGAGEGDAGGGVGEGEKKEEDEV